jgi:DNA modification methylase
VSVQIIRGNALSLPLENASVDLVVTSPPYFGLRSYQDGGEHYDGQIGAEATPAEFVDALIAATAEMVRVLKPSGSLWVNLGDKYAGAPSGPRKGMPDGATRKAEAHLFQTRSKRDAGVPTKSLIGVPWRYALRCIDDLGLILRAEVIRSKPNGLPESVTDRVRRSHETWFHFTREPRYFSAVDEVREAHSDTPSARSMANWTASLAADTQGVAGHGTHMPRGSQGQNPLGKLPGSVWQIATQPLQVPAYLGVDHFAAFPMEWPRRIIRGWSPSGICTACGDGRRPVVDKVTTGKDNSYDGRNRSTVDVKAWKAMKAEHPDRITGYACACPDNTAPTRPAVVLDPFSGTGTTTLVAHALGRHGIGVDMSSDYCRLARWRTSDPGELARALGVEKPAPVDPDQTDLLDMLGGDAA